ncbi:DUF6221 family protein [Amycolatopsis rhabdoformis]|uniref:DUF6221 family protein n=1 Tax=Amycolatopsis rhabdoformis TaxID=1448059 RepID=A0ABZ1HW45_9PSEU|nr:DUF6221 family protein [Amycolatopsis rhabdoformis]WSE26124.1 DUF6221 family protein [Amycolatopsis rhabdoformis]
MDDLIAFLRARLDEDERIAKTADPGPWHADGGGIHKGHTTDEVVDYAGDNAEHIARHDPARVLAEVAAKRLIIELHQPDHKQRDCGTCMSRKIGYQEDWIEEEWPCKTLCLLALPYADHPDYREEWRP